METNEIARHRTPRGARRPPPGPTPLECGDCQYVTFERRELSEHFSATGHKEAGLMQRFKRWSIEITLAAVLIMLGAISLGAVMAAIIWSAQMLIFLVIPGTLALIWWFRRG